MSAHADAPSKTFRYAPGPKCKALCEEESKNIAPGLQTIALYSQIALQSGHGRHLVDLDGKEYLDFVAGIGVAHDAGRRIVPQHALQAPGRLGRAVADDHHARVL